MYTAFEELPRSQIELLIDEWILAKRDREIVKRRLLDGATYDRIAEEFDLSVRHTKTIIYCSQNKILTKMTQKQPS